MFQRARGYDEAAKLTGQGWDSRPTGRAPLPMARLGRRESIVGGGDRSSSPAPHLQKSAAPSARKVRSNALQFLSSVSDCKKHTREFSVCSIGLLTAGPDHYHDAPGRCLPASSAIRPSRGVCFIGDSSGASIQEELQPGPCDGPKPDQHRL